MERSFWRVGRRDIRELKGRRFGVTLVKQTLPNMYC